MDLSPQHEAARIAACRLPALTASLARLAENTQRATIALYGTARPTPGDPPGADPVVILPCSARFGVIDDELFQIQMDVPIEAQVTGADPVDGTDAVWGRIFDGSGNWWGDISVSDQSGTGELKLISLRQYNGEFSRVQSGVFQG